MYLLRWFGMACWLLAASAGATPAATWTVDRTPAGATVKLDGQLVTEYLTNSGGKPILWPLLAPGGKAVTRSYPMADVAGEEKDHPHQRSCWFTHGKVNGVDFWSEQGTPGKIVHREFAAASGGQTARIVTRNDWLAPDGSKQCSDERQLAFLADEDRRIIDFTLSVQASAGPVTFGDTKEGCFGVRVASSIRVDSKRGGQIVNSAGQTDADAWGKRAAWVDYHGPVDGQTVGLALLNHPSSFRAPTYWHVRTYGLFTANPFGVNDFTGSGDGSHTLPAGESLTLRYRMVLHSGDEKQARIQELYEAYAKPQP